MAVGILALMGSILFGSLTQALRSRDRAQAVSQRYHQLRQASARIHRELGSAFLSEHRDCVDPRTLTVFSGRRANFGMRLDFTSFSHLKMLADANESDQNELSYYVANDPRDGSKKHLMRREQNRIDEHPTEGGDSEIMVEDVESLMFLFYNPKTDRWQDDWDNTSRDTRGKLPKFVDIRIGYMEGGELRYHVTKTRIFLKEALFFTGVSASRCPD